MSHKALPMLFINLGGEMLYILDQRLRAQSIPGEKAVKVMHDIIGTMFNKRFMDELFKPQDAYSKKAMRTVFNRLAHASIMRLNAASMDKLYDLMTMAVKYQMTLCPRPQDLLLITLNHMDAIYRFVQGNANVKQQVEKVYKQIILMYASLPAGEFVLIRQTLLGFFQDMHIRVSIFLKDKVQNNNGRFVLSKVGPVPFSCEVPGTMRFFNENGISITSVMFTAGGAYKGVMKEGVYTMVGERSTKLGTNMYSAGRGVEAAALAAPPKPVVTSKDIEQSAPNPLAKAELNLLSQLIVGDTKTPSGGAFRLNLFNTDAEEEEAEKVRPPDAVDYGTVINIDASKVQQSEELQRIMGDLQVGATSKSKSSASKGDDLLDLMDSAS